MYRETATLDARGVNPYSEYKSIFDLRGALYHEAMQGVPAARDLEFRLLFKSSKPDPHELVLDVPSLGAYLLASCPELGEVVSLDFAAPIHAGVRQVDPFAPWPVRTADRLVCLAASHHIKHLHEFLLNACRHLHPGSMIHLADVSLGSRIATFLDDFVGSYTPTGHAGVWRDFQAFQFPQPLRVSRIETCACPWSFASTAEMIWFCRKLFCLQHVSDADIHAALTSMVGVEYRANSVELNWELSYVDLNIA